MAGGLAALWNRHNVDRDSADDRKTVGRHRSIVGCAIRKSKAPLNAI